MKGKSQESNFIRHWVRIRLEGFKPEKLISSAVAKGINLKEICYKDETEVYLTAAKGQLGALRKLAGSKYRLTVISQGGVIPSCRSVWKNKMAIAGLCVFLLVFFAQTLFVREINVVGCRTITETSIRQTLAEEGLYEGALKKFDADRIERRLFQDYETIVWARVAYEGNYVEVQISESRQVPLGEEDRKPCNIVADKDCYIERIYTYKGRAKVRENDFVRKGGILISGKVPIEHPSYPVEEGKKLWHYTHADGKVTARVPYYYSFVMKPQKDEKSRNKEAQRLLRQWIKENVPESAEILNKDFHFDAKKNIIKVYGTVETRQQVGIEKEIVIDKHKRGTEKNSNR